MAAQKPPLFARMFPIEKISVLQAQFFDNRKRADGTKGQSDYALKLFAWHRLNNITLIADADWWRVIQLIEPKAVLRWCREKHATGDMTAAQFAIYDGVAKSAAAMADSGDYSLVKMGHVSSPPGKQYCVGQFVVVTRLGNEPIKAILNVDGDAMVLDSIKPTRSRGNYRKPGSPLCAMLHDPHRLVGQTRSEPRGEALVQSGPVRSLVEDRRACGLPVTTEDMLREAGF